VEGQVSALRSFVYYLYSIKYSLLKPIGAEADWNNLTLIIKGRIFSNFWEKFCLKEWNFINAGFSGGLRRTYFILFLSMNLKFERLSVGYTVNSGVLYGTVADSVPGLRVRWMLTKLKLRPSCHGSLTDSA